MASKSSEYTCSIGGEVRDIEHVLARHFHQLLVDIDGPVNENYGNELALTALPDDSSELYLKLHRAIVERGYPIREFDVSTDLGRFLIDQVQVSGFSHLHDQSIAVRGDISSRAKVLILLHEYGHQTVDATKEPSLFLARHDPAGYAWSECGAEAMSYVVGAYFGIVNPDSVPYLRRVGAANVLPALHAQSAAILGEATRLIQAVLAPTHV